MKATDFFNDYRFLTAADVEKPVKVTILDVISMNLGGKEKLLLKLSNEYYLPLNKTNLQAMVDLFGDDTDDWINKKITLVRVRVQYLQKPTDGVRIDS